MKRISMLVTVALVLALGASIVHAQSGYDLFQKALVKERAVGDVEEAIRLYQRVVNEFGSNHALAAKAELRLGLLYERLGRKGEAQRAFKAVVSQYADQADIVRQARAKITPAEANANTAAIKKKSSGLSVEKLPPTDLVNETQSLSPDGKKMAVMNYSLGQNIAVYDYATKRLTLVTHFDWSKNSRYTYFPIWSRDGREIAYLQAGLDPQEAAEVRVSTVGSASRILYRNEANPGAEIIPSDWLRDGSAVVAVVQRGDKTYTLGLIPATGGSFKALRSLQWNFDYASRPNASPDGRFIVFEDGPQGARNLQIISIDGQSLNVLTDHPADDKQPRWSPDGKHIVFLSQRHGSWALWGVAIENGKPIGQPFMIKEGMQDAGLLNWTARGLVYRSSFVMRDVFTMAVDPATGEPSGRPQQIPYSRTGHNVSPVWSPDGRYLAFASSAVSEPGQGNIVVLPAAGGKGREFLIPINKYQGLDLYDLRWLSDASGLGFSGLDNKEQHTLFRLTLATGEWKTWPLPVKGWTRTEWSRDGNKYFYVVHGPTPEPGIVEHDLATGRERYVYRPDHSAKDGFMVRSLRFSPDYKWLAFSEQYAERGDQIAGLVHLHLMVMDMETGRARQVTSEDIGSPSWSPDGQHLVVNGSRDKNGVPTGLQIVPVTGGPARKLDLGDSPMVREVAEQAPKRKISSPDWSPDGKQITFGASVMKLETFLMENVIPAAQSRRTIASRR